MSGPPDLSRRDFLRRSGAGAAGALYAGPASAQAPAPGTEPARLPREIWIATLSLAARQADSPEAMVRAVLDDMEEIAASRPDVVCLPEVFAFARVRTKLPPLAEIAEEPLGPVTRPFSEYAKRHRCYVVCPTYTREGSRFFISAVFIDREGRPMGEYRKMRPTEDEMAMGISPGPADPPVFRTDFGVVGAQICFDIGWDDGWRSLRRQGAEIVFWPSAFAGGRMVDTAAWRHKVHVVSSTQKDTAKICDISGEVVASTDRWSPRWVCAPVNLEKVFLHTWPYVRHFDAIRAKYGRGISITTYAEEEWSILESRSAEVRVADVMEEFGLKSYEEHLRSAERAQREVGERT